MMGHTARALAPLAAVTRDDRVPADLVYRHLGRTLALAFVRDLVRDRNAPGGRPSSDPIVCFKLRPIMFFEGIRSERRRLKRRRNGAAVTSNV